jgi:hypothetical protein
VIVVTKRIADAEMHCILGHLRGCGQSQWQSWAPWPRSWV